MKDELSRTIFEVFRTQFALESVRAKELARALEILELELDVNILRLHALAKECDPSERERVVSTLRQVRSYRQSHPRRVESDLSTVAKGVLARSVTVSKERIREILDKAE
jgi:LmbE family N-acetylglucosaminyl deacetylase